MKHNLLAGVLAGAALLFCPTVGALANDTDSDSQLTYYLRMVDKDGLEMIVPFSENPEISHQDNALVLSSDKTYMEFPDGTLEYFDITTEKPANDVYKLADESVRARGGFVGDNICFTGGTPGAPLSVVTIDGSVVISTCLDNEGNAVVPFAPIKGGIYVINSGKTTFKIIKK